MAGAKQVTTNSLVFAFVGVGLFISKRNANTVSGVIFACPRPTLHFVVLSVLKVVSGTVAATSVSVVTVGGVGLAAAVSLLGGGASASSAAPNLVGSLL